jgi:outer membrane receptor protein involved in Fe transport
VQLDLGMRYTSPGFRVATFFYNYRIDDLIERYSTQSDFFFFRNRGRGRVRGFEIEAQASLPWSVSVESAFQVARGRALDDNTSLDDMPPETFSIQGRKSFAFRDSFAQIRLALSAEDTRPGPTERTVPGATVLDAGGGIRIVDAFEVRLSARNLLNDSYLASQDVRTVPAPGRSVALTAVVRFTR